jgi:Zn-dependent protease with chaperone function
MKFPWFKRSGILCLPVSVMGWITLIAGIVAAVYLFICIDSRSHSASDTLRPFIIDLVLLFILYSCIGFLSSRNRKG